MSNRIVVYHDNCHDGISAAWAALQSRRWADAELYPGNHGHPPDLSKLKGKHVLMVDFCWPRSFMYGVAMVADSLTVLDHHVTAKEDMEGFAKEASNIGLAVFLAFDMHRSGAGLTWDYLHGSRDNAPKLISYVEDRDLFNFILPMSKEVHLACNTRPLTIKDRNVLMTTPIEVLQEIGGKIRPYHDKMINELASKAFLHDIAGYRVPALQIPIIGLVSDACHAMLDLRNLDPKVAESCPTMRGRPQFSGAYFEKSDGTQLWSLRSSNELIDVSEIAKRCGGGGHRNAAGFRKKA